MTKYILMFVLVLKFILPTHTSLAEGSGMSRIVSIQDLSKDHDYEKVTVISWVKKAMIFPTRRLDGRFVKIIIGGSGDINLLVVTTIPILGRIINECVIVQGVYRREGRFAGLLMPEDFIITENIHRLFLAPGERCE